MVTNGEYPCWLRSGPSSNLSTVERTKLVPCHGDLPTWNSYAIEAHLHRIPGLGEHFIYFNDDMLVGRPLSKAYFFEHDGRPRLPYGARGRWGTTGGHVNDDGQPQFSPINESTCVGSYAAEHITIPARKSQIFEIQELYPSYFQLMSKYRCRHQMLENEAPESSLCDWRPPFWVYNWYAIASGRANLVRTNESTVPWLRDKNVLRASSWYDSVLNGSNDIIIVNDDFAPSGTRLFDTQRRELCHFLELKYGYWLTGDESYETCSVIMDSDIPLPQGLKDASTTNEHIKSTLGAVESGHIGTIPLSLGTGTAEVVLGDTVSVILFNAERGTQWKKQCTQIKSDPRLVNATLIILNEMDSGMARSGNVDTTHELASCLHMNYAFAVEFVELTLGQAKELKGLADNATNDRSLHGNAILSRYPLRELAVVPLPGTGEYWRKGGFDGENRLGDRMALFAAIPVIGHSKETLWVDIVSTHLDNFIGEVYNEAAAATIADVLQNRTRPRASNSIGAIVGGDLGSPDESSSAAEYWHNHAGFHDPRSSTAMEPGGSHGHKGDWVVTSGSVVAVDGSPAIVETRYSDHNFMRLDLRILEPGAAGTKIREKKVLSRLQCDKGDPEERSASCVGRGSCSQPKKGQDLWVLSTYPDKDSRFFVDLAASSPVCGSDTVVLERNYGWSGICIDAEPKYVQRLRNQRQCTVVNAAVSDSDGQELEFVTGKNGLSGLIDGTKYDNKHAQDASRTIRVNTSRLETLLRKHGAPSRIAYLSLDVEGAESAALRESFPWSEYIFETLTVERSPPDLNARLFRNGYLFVKNQFYDTFFVHTTHPYATLLARNSSFEQLAAKCSVGTTPIITFLQKGSQQCPGPYGCCEFEGAPQATVRYGPASSTHHVGQP